MAWTVTSLLRLSRRVGLLGLLLLAGGLTHAQPLPGRWHLEVLDPQQRPVVKLTVRFSDVRADSCLGLGEGDKVLPWHQLVVESTTASDEAFFPSKDPLAFARDGDALTLGRVAACDAYRLLRGSVAQGTGRYVSLGKGGERVLGSFRLTRLK